MIEDIEDAVGILKGLKTKFEDLNDADSKLTTDDLHEATDAIEKLKSAKQRLDEWTEAFGKIDLPEIEALLNHNAVEEFAAFDREQSENAHFRAIDDGDEEKLSGKQQIATNHAQEIFDDCRHAAKDQLEELGNRIDSAVNSLDALL